MRMLRLQTTALCLALLALVTAGCGSLFDDSSSAGAASTQSPTWYKDVAPIVTRRCTGCHTSGGIAPFPLNSYESAQPFAGLMVERVKSGEMPPWHAVETADCKPRFPWKDDLRLSDAEKSVLERWAAAGAPAGDAGKPAALPSPPSLDLADRNMRVAMTSPYLVQGARDVFRCFSLPHEFTEDSWLTGLQVIPGNSKVVHHVLVWLDKDKRGDALARAEGSYECFGAPGFPSALLGAWAPGAMPMQTPADTALRVPKGSKIVINVHYHPTGGAAMDASSLDLRWTTKRPTYEALLALPGNAQNARSGLLPGPADPPTGPAFMIPAGVPDHTEGMDITVPPELIIPAKIFAVGTHMHYVGTDMRIEIDRAQRLGGAPPGEPMRECLLETPRWDFHWQRGYSFDASFDKLPTVMAGDVLRLRCQYDNTMQNRFVAQALKEQGLSAPREVRLGEQTLDEMCLGAFGIAFPARP